MSKFGSIIFKNPVVGGNFCELWKSAEELIIGASVTIEDGKVKQCLSGIPCGVVCSKEVSNFITKYTTSEELHKLDSSLICFNGCCYVLKSSIKNPSWIFIREIDEFGD